MLSQPSSGEVVVKSHRSMARTSLYAHRETAVCRVHLRTAELCHNEINLFIRCSSVE